MIRKKKAEECRNCGANLKNLPNFCPECGQENTTYKLTFMELAREFSDSTFNLNSKFFASLFPFLFKPGFLTKAFLEGRRKKYVHPIRFYLLMSLFCFFILAFFEITKPKVSMDFYNRMPFTESEIENHLKKTDKLFLLASKNDLIDSLSYAEFTNLVDSLDPKSLLNLIIRNESDSFSINEKYFKFDWNVLMHDWAKRDGMTPEILLDSIGVENPNFLEKLVAKKLLKYAEDNDPKTILGEIIDNIPILIFLLLPVFALILKLLYIRRKQLYVEHLVFAIYLHAYLFLMIALAIMGYHWIGNWLIAIPILATFVYIFLMFKNVYQQHWFKTIVKIFLIFQIYGIALSIGLGLEATISLLTF